MVTNSVEYLKAPFPYFGGKSRVASVVWDALGDVAHYIEPFFGSGAVLLARRDYDALKHTETINDKCGYIANVWRAIKFAPDDVAKWCDWPVNHADLMARRRELIKNEENLLRNLVADDRWYDAVMAGYWVWAASLWIGSGLTKPCAIPHISDKGKGVHKTAIRGKRPELVSGKGVHRRRNYCQAPHLTSKGSGISQTRDNDVYEWLETLSVRLRNVRVVCGDWGRVCGGNWQADKWSECGIFFDPPYSAIADRDNELYSQESLSVAIDVQRWALNRGKRHDYRIVLAGYYDEHKDLLDNGWTVYQYSANGGYANIGKKDSKAKANRHKECLFFSPYCLRKQKQLHFTGIN